MDTAQASAHDKPKTILIADDSAMVRTIIREGLERDTDFEVCGEAVDGTDAVSKAKELSPDLILLDVRMPGLNGIEVAGILRHALPRIRIASRVTGDCQARFCERLGVKFPGPTRPGVERRFAAG